MGEADVGGASLKRLIDLVPEGAFTLANQALFTVPAVVIPVAAYITGEMARFDLVENIARSIFASPNAVPATKHAAQIGLALIAVQRRDTTAASEMYVALQPIAGTMAPQTNMGPGLAIDRLLGLLAHTMGNLDQAAGHFEDALAFCRKAGFRPELAWTCCDYADLLLQRSQGGDRTKAVSLLDESLAISSELGMRPLMERVLSRREILRA